MMTKRLLDMFICLICVLFVLLSKNQAQVLLCVDAGHGGSDGGPCAATSLDTAYCEKELNLSILLMLRDTLLYEYLFTDTCDIFYTRYIDTFLPLERRAFLADSIRARSFISIHHNSLGPTIQRTETFFCKMFQTPEGDTWEEGAFRNIDTTLAAMLALRLNDELGFGFGWQPEVVAEIRTVA